MEQAASVAAAAATAVVAVAADKDAKIPSTKRKSSFGASDSTPAVVKRPTKITDFWKPPSVSATSNGTSEDQDKILNQKTTVSKSPCSDRTNTDASSNHAFKTARDTAKELNECREAPASPSGLSGERIRSFEAISSGSEGRNMHVDSNETNGNDIDDVVVVSESPAKSPRKSQRNTPAKSYKEYDKNFYEDKKPSKGRNRSYEKFREFFKNTAERSKEPKIVEKKAPKPPPENALSLNGFKKRLSTDSSSSTTPKRRGRPPRSEEEREARKQEYKKKISEKLKEKRKLEREAKQKERILDDDLFLPNLIPLPAFTEIECGIPKEGLGEFFCILEFMTAFSKELGVKDYFSQGISFDILERAFTEVDALGLLVNVFQILLSRLMKLQLSDWTIDYSTQNEGDDLCTKMAAYQEQAAAAGREFRDTYGFMFHTVPLDSFTYSDVVRYHLKASGAPGIDLRDRIHCHQGFTPKEDPGLVFVMRNPEIMEKLEKNSMASLDVLEKMKIVRCLIDQLLTFGIFREAIEDGLEKCVELKIQLKKLHWRKKLLDDEEKGIKRDKDEEAAAAAAAVTQTTTGNDDEKKRRNWRYVLPEMPREEIEKRIEQTEDEIGKVWYRFGLSNLGEDRAHRIYSVLHSVPAIVVEVLPCVEAPCIEGGTPENDADVEMKEEIKAENGEDLRKDSHLVCSGSIETCAIHKEKEPQYLFISSQEQLDSLLSSLATKGVRESVLKETIVNEVEYLKSVLKKTPLSKLNRTLNEAVRRRYPSDAFKVSNVFGLRPNLALNLTFRELLLDIEEKSVQASLGGFKDEERRRMWRLELEEPLLKMQNLEPEKTNELFPESEDETELQFLIPKLSEFCESIPVKFLKAPLGDQGPSLRNKLDNWRAALPFCRNLSQLFLFYSSLESSIEWQKGLTNARCKVCRGKATPDRMIRCETCDLVFHLPCIKPALREIPRGEWFCKACTPETVPDSPRKKPKVTSAEDEEESTGEVPESNDFCEVCLNDEQLISCGSCPRSFHLICIQMKRAPRRDWRCLACTAGVKKYKQELKDLKKIIEEKEAFEAKDSNEEDFSINQCLKCGELLSRGHIECIGCGRKYHLACADLTKRPKGDWYCKKRCEPGYVSLNQTMNGESDEEESEEEEVVDEEQQVEVDVDGFDYKACCDILDVLKRSDHAWPFLVPVSKKDAPDYLKIIKKPMDLGTIQTKLNDMKYTTNVSFVNDVLQVFINCEAYNLEEAEVYKEGKRLLGIFMGLLDNYSMSSLLNPQEFRWLEEVIRSKCTKCRMDFPYGIKKVCCRLCYTTLHLKCAGLRISVEKWLCPACVGKEPEADLDDEEDIRETSEENHASESDLVNAVEVDGFDYKGCTEILETLVKDNLSFPFRRPVTKKEAPDYFDIIEHPMDLSTIQSSLNNMGYQHNKQFIDDILLMFRNCERYNDERSSMYAGAMQFWKTALKKITDTGYGSLIDPDKVPKWNPPKNSRRSTH
ncbi:bromodomain adjacent to zinc finger domain protein 1A [Galendromus occidentalis]|uniref:Bromodomain adjacent to zinc finger domain protein 1A n=1 Tax=Galendromus occidentalis TaxID=34638 RepID=A0AAJ6QTM5_9ACAR|nr:bromodomain adjacent to zinc finger domain protein 1A [Galendromus occidentalis]